MEKQREYLSPNDVARETGLHAVTVRLMARRGRLPFGRIGNRWLITREDLERHMAEQAEAVREQN